MTKPSLHLASDLTYFSSLWNFWSKPSLLSGMSFLLNPWLTHQDVLILPQGSTIWGNINHSLLSLYHHSSLTATFIHAPGLNPLLFEATGVIFKLVHREQALCLPCDPWHSKPRSATCFLGSLCPSTTILPIVPKLTSHAALDPTAPSVWGTAHHHRSGLCTPSFHRHRHSGYSPPQSQLHLRTFHPPEHILWGQKEG